MARRRITTTATRRRLAAQTPPTRQLASVIRSRPARHRVQRALKRPFLFLSALLVAWAPCLSAQSPHRELYLYKGADRDQRVLEGARKERYAVVYTSLN